MNETQIKQREFALSRSGGKCEVCGAPLGIHTQGAHRIGNTKINRRKYGNFVIDHPFNIGMVCCLACNSRLDISRNTGEVIRLCNRIYASEARKYGGYDE